MRTTKKQLHVYRDTSSILINEVHRHALNFLGPPHGGGGNMIELTDLKHVSVHLS